MPSIVDSEFDTTPLPTEGQVKATLPFAASISPALFRFLHANPGLVVTLGYLLLTAIGISYDVQYYQRFRIPILNFSEASDFLLAGFRQPILLILFVLSIWVLWQLIHLDRKWRTLSASYKALSERMEQSQWYNTWIIYPLCIFIYFWSTTALYASYTASRIHIGQGKKVEVVLNTGSLSAKPDTGDSTQILIGTNSKYLFLYSIAGSSVRIVPISNVSYLHVISAKENPSTNTIR